MKKLELIKTGVSIIVSVGVGAVVSNVIKTTTPDTTGTIKKVCIGIGSFVLSSMITDQATTYTETKIDETVDQMKEMVESIQN